MTTSEEQQLLLNIVRNRFGDKMYFITVGSITTSDSLQVSAGGSYTNNPSSGNSITDNLNVIEQVLQLTSRTVANTLGTSSWGLTPNVSYSDSPTVSYAPLQGEKFTREMLTPISINTLSLLLQTSWGFYRVMRVFVERIDRFDNPSNTYKHIIPDFKKFVELVLYVRDLQRKNMLYFELGEITEVSAD